MPINRLFSDRSPKLQDYKAATAGFSYVSELLNQPDFLTQTKILGVNVGYGGSNEQVIFFKSYMVVLIGLGASKYDSSCVIISSGPTMNTSGISNPHI
jgi:hypothetical protein